MNQPLPPPTTLARGYLLTVDPGLNACGAALFYQGALVMAWAERAVEPVEGMDRWARMAQGVWARVAETSKVDLDADAYMIVETMRPYPTRSVPVEDLIALAAVGGAMSAAARLYDWTPLGVDAPTWNGQVPGDVRRMRTQGWVAEHEWLDKVDLNTTKRFQQDVWSALGIAKFALTGRR